MNKQIFEPFDERRILAKPGNTEETLSFAVDHFIEIAKEAIVERNLFTVALSGGSTPKKIFQRLSKPPYKDAIDWTKVLVFWSDERAVPPTHPDSNYKMAMDSGFSSLPIPKEQIFRMHAEENIEENASKYEEEILKRVKSQSLDLVMLGMGDDGHTASLFPGTNGLDILNRLVIANYIPQKGCMRMTFTFTLINKAKHIALYVLGEDKAERVQAVFTDETNTFPSARVGTKETPALWILDDLASRLLR